MHPLESPEALAYRFSDASLLRQALTHRSHSQPHNERLEFIGDSVLNCVIAEALYRRFPDLPEGPLSRLRATLVEQSTLAERSAALGVGQALQLGEGERRSGGHGRPSMLADALEALVGAVFLDGGFDRAREVVLRLFSSRLEALDTGDPAKDPKTALQEWLQARRLALPEYRVLTVSGETHRQIFEVECHAAARGVRAAGQGTSRRGAEQQAAARVLALIEAGGRS